MTSPGLSPPRPKKESSGDDDVAPAEELTPSEDEGPGPSGPLFGEPAELPADDPRTPGGVETAAMIAATSSTPFPRADVADGTDELTDGSGTESLVRDALERAERDAAERAEIEAAKLAEEARAAAERAEAERLEREAEQAAETARAEKAAAKEAAKLARAGERQAARQAKAEAKAAARADKAARREARAAEKLASRAAQEEARQQAAAEPVAETEDPGLESDASVELEDDEETIKERAQRAYAARAAVEEGVTVPVDARAARAEARARRRADAARRRQARRSGNDLDADAADDLVEPTTQELDTVDAPADQLAADERERLDAAERERLEAEERERLEAEEQERLETAERERLEAAERERLEAEERERLDAEEQERQEAAEQRRRDEKARKVEAAALARQEKADAKRARQEAKHEAKAAKRDAKAAKAAEKAAARTASVEIADDDHIVEPPPERVGRRGTVARRTAVSLVLVVAMLALVASVVLAIGALLAAISADTDQSVVGAVSSICDVLDGPLGGLVDFSGDNAIDKERLLSRGIASMIFLGVGVLLPLAAAGRDDD